MAEKATAVTGQAVPFGAALRFWFRLGWINFGGPAGQIAIMHRELVEKRRWISDERFLHALNFCMLLPGPEAQQLAIYIGWLQHGVRGGMVAGVFFVLPGFVLVTAIAWLYTLYRSLSWVDGILFGLKAAVLAVVIEAIVRIGKRTLKNRIAWCVAALAFLGIFVFSIPFPLIILSAALVGLIVRRTKSNGAIDSGAIASEAIDSPAAQPRVGAVKILVVCGVLWVFPVVLIAAILGAGHTLVVEGIFFSKMAVVTFGGAYAVLAYVAQEAVTRFGWLNASDMVQGLSLAETTPGPLILVLTFVGFLGAYRFPGSLDPTLAGLIGALLTTWVTFVPCFLWVFLGAPHIERLRSNQALSSAMSMVTAAVVGVILNLSIWFALHVLFHGATVWQGFGLTFSIPDWATLDLAAVMISVFAMIAMLRLKIPMLWVLGLSGGFGVVLKFLDRLG